MGTNVNPSGPVSLAATIRGAASQRVYARLRPFSGEPRRPACGDAARRATKTAKARTGRPGLYSYCQHSLWPTQLWPNILMAYIAMAYVVMANIFLASTKTAEARTGRRGLYSYGLYRYGLYSYGLDSYGLGKNCGGADRRTRLRSSRTSAADSSSRSRTR